MLGRGLRHAHELRDRNGRQPLAGRGLPQQIAADDADVGQAHLDKRLAGAEVGDDRAIDALVGRAPAENRNVEHAQYTPSTTAFAKRENGRTLRTPSHGYFVHGGSRSASSRSRNRGMKNSFVSVVNRTRPVSP